MTIPSSKAGLRWPERLEAGVLLKRYKRFLADVRLDNGQTITAHCPNSGSMKGCADPGQRVYVSHQDNPRRKLKYTWELIDLAASLVGINTNVPNRLVKAAVTNKEIFSLADYEAIQPEVSVGRGKSRLDFRLTGRGRPDCYVEVKNCTLVSGGLARFPDAVTARGQRHLRELAALRQEGHRSVIFFLVQRTDADRFAPADEIDPEYGRQLRQAVAKGVEIMAYDVALDLTRIRLNRSLPCFL